MQQVNDGAAAIGDNAAMVEPAFRTEAADLHRARTPGLLRRLATMVYDLILLGGVLVLAAAIFVIPIQAMTGVPLASGPLHLLFQLYLLAVILLYYLYFWTHGRRTLGMLAWRTRLVRDDGADLSVADALRRIGFAALTLAPLGIGLLWVLFDRDGLAWYDRLSGTRPVLPARGDRPPRRR